MIDSLNLKREGQVAPEAAATGQTNYPGTNPLSPCLMPYVPGGYRYQGAGMSPSGGPPGGGG